MKLTPAVCIREFLFAYTNMHHKHVHLFHKKCWSIWSIFSSKKIYWIIVEISHFPFQLFKWKFRTEYLHFKKFLHNLNCKQYQLLLFLLTCTSFICTLVNILTISHISCPIWFFIDYKKKLVQADKGIKILSKCKGLRSNWSLVCHQWFSQK